MRSRSLPLLGAALLLPQADAQLRADIQKNTPPGQATMRVYDGQKLLFQATTQGLQAVTGSKFSPDGKWLLNIADGQGYVQLWDVGKGERLQTYLAPVNQYRLIDGEFTPDSQRFILNFLGDGTSRTKTQKGFFVSPLRESSLWEIRTKRRLAIMSVLGRESSYNRDVHFSRDGTLMGFTDGSGPASVFNAVNGAYVQTFSRLRKPDGSGSGAVDARFSPDGTRVLVLYVDGRLAEYDADTAKLLKLRGKPAEAQARAQLEVFARTGK